MKLIYDDIDKFEQLVSNQNDIDTINIFDFDGTLFNSPNPNPLIWNNKMIGLLKSSYEQGGYGWYQNPITLDDKYIGDSTFIQHVVDDAVESIANPNAVTVMLTGRSEAYEQKIKSLLDKQGLVFDHYGFKPLDTSESTMGFKQRFIDELIEKYPSVSTVNMWEDRPKHVIKFKEFLDSKNLNNFVTFIEHPREHVMKNYMDEIDLVNQLLLSERIDTLVESVNPQSPKYVGVMLDRQSHKKLLNELHSVIPRDWKKIAHHMTIKLGNKPDNLSQFIEENFGKDFSLTATEVGISPKAIAVKIQSEVPTKNSIPHVTVAVSPIGKPVDSNYITDWKPLASPIQMTGTLSAQY